MINAIQLLQSEIDYLKNDDQDHGVLIEEYKSAIKLLEISEMNREELDRALLKKQDPDLANERLEKIHKLRRMP